jgi:proteasome lid subunit RPN8/RPN11
VDIKVADTLTIDISDIDFSGWAQRPMGAIQGLREGPFQAVFMQSALDEIHLHGQSSAKIEICGVLIGNGFRDEQGPYLLVEHVIRGNGAKNKSTSVTFTADTWASIQTVMDKSYPDKKMLGWYHTHPGFGIFLSDMDIFICENFFNLPWQIAFVYDPVSGEEGNFIWKEGRPKREYVLIEDDVTPKAAAIPLIPRDEIPSGDLLPDVSIPPRPVSVQNGDPRLVELMIRVRRLERRQKTIVTAVAFIAAFVIMWALMFQQPINSTINKAASQPTTNNLQPTTKNAR